MITLKDRKSATIPSLPLGRPRSGLLTFALLAAGSFSGCAPMPVATNPPYSTQQKMRSVSHWQILANQTALAVPPALIGQQKVLYVKGGATGTFFDQAFEVYLTGALTSQCLKPPTTGSCFIAQGHRVLQPLATSINEPYITYGLVKVHHRDRDIGRTPMGTFTLLGAGIWLGHEVSEHWSSASRYAAAPATGALVDLLSGIVAGPTHTEVIVSVALIGSDGGTQFRNDQSFYVDDADADEYPNEPLYTPLGPPVAIHPIANDIIKIKHP